MSAVQMPAEPGLHARLRWVLADSLVLARRNLAHVRQIPEKLIDVTLQPLVFVLLFAYVFGGVIAVPDGSYREYLVGGVLVQTLAFGIMGPATSIATDLTEGIVDRFRTLPMARSAYLLGHLTAELAFITMFPLTFLANAFVPAAGLPDGLQAIAEWNPVSAVIAAVRTLFGNPTATPADAAWPLQHPVIAAIGWCIVILAVTVPLTVWRFRARTTD
jgi:ABC-2 type transport system permease protein